MSSFKAAIYTGLALALTACTSTPPPEGESLSGWKGNVRRYLPIGSQGTCPDSIQKYIAASGHSAYASTEFKSYTHEQSIYICGSSLNQKSVEAAEAAALRHCEAGTRRWGKAYKGKCTIHASK